MIMGRMIPRRVLPHVERQREVSAVWRKRLREARFHRAAQLFVFALACEAATVWMFWATSRSLADSPLALLLYTVPMAFTVVLGMLTTAMSVVFAYTYLVVEIQARLPGAAALLLSLAVAAGTRWFDARRFVLHAGQWIYPPDFRPHYLGIADAMWPYVRGLATFATVALALLGVFVQVSLFVGLHRHGEKFRDSKRYRFWTAESEPIPSIVDIVAGRIGKLRQPPVPVSVVELDEPHVAGEPEAPAADLRRMPDRTRSRRLERRNRRRTRRAQRRRKR